MATTALSGKNGSVSATGGTGSVGSEVVSWDATLNIDLPDATSFDSNGWADHVEGVQSGSGSFTAIGTAPVTGSVTTLTLDVGNTTGDLRLTGAATISTNAISTPVDGRVEYACDFTFKGEVTNTTVP